MRNSEIVYIYDAKKVNPNGDPIEDNRPRIDEETGHLLVSDVRLKRTIRDYLHATGENVFIVQHINEDGTTATRDQLIQKFGITKPKDLFNFVDIRAFGTTIASKDKTFGNFNRTGPIQFRFGESLHPVEPVKIEGTTVIASKDGRHNGTFWNMWMVPYACISVYGVICGQNAKYTELTEEDITKILNALWNGTNNLVSRSKIGQTSRLLIRVKYNEDHFYIGDIERYIKTKIKDNPRDIEDVEWDFSELFDVLKKYKDKIEVVEYRTQIPEFRDAIKNSGIPYKEI